MSDPLIGGVIAAVLAAVGALLYTTGYSAGLKDSPAHFAYRETRDAADEAIWRDLHAEHIGEPGTCQAIIDLVRDDLAGSELVPETVSPHKE